MAPCSNSRHFNVWEMLVWFRGCQGLYQGNPELGHLGFLGSALVGFSRRGCPGGVQSVCMSELFKPGQVQAVESWTLGHSLRPCSRLTSNHLVSVGGAGGVAFPGTWSVPCVSVALAVPGGFM